MHPEYQLVVRTWPEYRAVLDAVIKAGVDNGTTGALALVDALVAKALEPNDGD